MCSPCGSGRVGHREVGPLVTGLLAAAGEGDERGRRRRGRLLPVGRDRRTTGTTRCRGRGSGDLPTHERAFLRQAFSDSPDTIRTHRCPAGWVAGKSGPCGGSRLAACRAPRRPVGAPTGPARLPGLRLRRAAAPCGARGVRRCARRGVRRPATTPPRGARARLVLDNARAATPRRSASDPTRSRSRLRHRGRPPRPARAASRRRPHGARTSSTPPSSTRRCCTPPSGQEPPTRSVPVDPSGRVRLDDLDVTDAAVVACQSANHEVGTVQPVAEVAAAHRRRPALRRRLRLGRAARRCQTAGRRWRRRRTSGAGPPGVGVLARTHAARGGATRSPRTIARASARAVSRTCRRSSPRPRRCRPCVAERAAENARTHALVDRIRRVVGGDRDVEVVGDPVDRLPHLVTFSCLYVDGEALVTELDRLRVRRGQRIGLHGLVAGAQPRAGGDGRAHPRQRPGLGRPRDDRGRRRPVPRVLPGAVEPTPATRVCDCSSWTAAGSSARSRSSSWPDASATVEVGELVGVVADDAAARVDVPAWCRMTGQEYVGEESAEDGVPRYVVRRVS